MGLCPFQKYEWWNDINWKSHVEGRNKHCYSYLYVIECHLTSFPHCQSILYCIASLCLDHFQWPFIFTQSLRLTLYGFRMILQWFLLWYCSAWHIYRRYNFVNFHGYFFKIPACYVMNWNTCQIKVFSCWKEYRSYKAFFLLLVWFQT